MACVLLDVDGTLLDTPSSERLFVAYLARRHRLGVKQVSRAAGFCVRWGPRLRRDVLRKNKAYLAGLKVDLVTELAEAFVARELAPRVRPLIMQRLNDHLEAGEPIALVTGTLEFIARPLARAVGAETWRATRCASDGSHFTAGLPLAHPFGEEKVRLSAELCAELGCRLSQCVAYADSAHDLPLLSRVGRPVAAWPDRRLGKAARRKGWEILGPSKPQHRLRPLMGGHAAG
ncbi:MAG: HAD family hydrolase [Alphaproteobacteria bacterium]